MAGEGDADSVSMVEVLQENIDLEEEATAVLGNSDDSVCTYPQGYVLRQAIYACVTCKDSSEQPAGVCLACSYACHDGHELWELYTKRNFQCDCGNDKFPGFTCKLYKDKKPVNSCNKYNQNFQGLYCTCKRPYPDPEDEIEDEMIQCVICEDWYHGRHLGKTGHPSNKNYEEMICADCMDRCEFLWAYNVQEFEIINVKPEGGVGEKVEVEIPDSDSTKKRDPSEEKMPSDPGPVQDSSTQPEEQSVSPPKSPSAKANNASCEGTVPELTKSETLSNSPPPEKQNTPQNPSAYSTICNENDKPVKNNDAVGETLGSSKVKNIGEEGEGPSQSGVPCALKDLQKRGVKKLQSASTFWRTGWRSKLCQCEECKDLYDKLGIPFICDESDTVVTYERSGKEKHGSSQYEAGIEALSGMDRVQQMEMLHGYNDMKSELRDFLQEFAAQGKVVKREDIDQFFQQMQARKRQKTGPMQYFCR